MYQKRSGPVQTHTKLMRTSDVYMIVSLHMHITPYLPIDRFPDQTFPFRPNLLWAICTVISEFSIHYTQCSTIAMMCNTAVPLYPLARLSLQRYPLI